MKFLCFLICLLCLQIVDSYCEGEWKSSTTSSSSSSSSSSNNYSISAARTAIDPDHLNTSQKQWVAQACPFQMSLYSCYFHTNHTLAALLEERIFYPHDKTERQEGCLPFHPHDFLTLLQGRHLVFLGDSILLQIWESLACTFYPLTPVQHHVSFVSRKPCNVITCPETGTKRFSYLNYGWIHLPVYRTTLTVLMIPKMNLPAIRNVYRRFRLTQYDLVFMNFGLHYNNPDELSAHLDGLVRESFVQGKGHPTIFYLESSPQHFSANANGYYPLHDTWKIDLKCQPLRQEAIQGQLDWRNQVISRALVNVSRDHLVVLPIAQGLYSQYDGHVGKSTVLTQLPLDCTHWCFPSNIFKYIHQVLYNGIHRQLQDKPSPTVSHEDHNTVFYGPSLVEGSLIRCQGDPNGTIYLLQKGRRRAFLQRIDLELAGYRLRDIIMMTKEEVQHIPLGLPFPSLQKKSFQEIGEELDQMEQANWSKQQYHFNSG